MELIGTRCLEEVPIIAARRGGAPIQFPISKKLKIESIGLQKWHRFPNSSN
jgi:hypothetical protein